MKRITDEYAWMDDELNATYADKYARFITENVDIKEGMSEEHIMNRLMKYANKVTKFGQISMRSITPQSENRRYDYA